MALTSAAGGGWPLCLPTGTAPATGQVDLSYLALVGGPRNGPGGHPWHSPNLVRSRQRLGSPAGLVSKPPDHTRLPVPGGQAGHPITSRREAFSPRNVATFRGWADY